VKALLKLKYIKLEDVAIELDCKVSDIVHFAAHGVIQVGLPYQSDGFSLDHIRGIETVEGFTFLDNYIEIEDGYSGFAFIDSGYLLDAEQNEVCRFTSLTLDDGRNIGFAPTEDSSSWQHFVLNGVPNSKLYMLQNDFKNLKQFLKSDNDKVFLANKERESMLKIIHALAKNCYKYPNRGALQEMLDDFQRSGNGVSEKTLKKYLDEADAL
jgi:major membrane immunogen (membrane-anchored lipoprotein)